jgi:hypothetical protein
VTTRRVGGAGTLGESEDDRPERVLGQPRAQRGEGEVDQARHEQPAPADDVTEAAADEE